MSKKKAGVRYSEALAKKICKHIEEGLSVSEMIRKFPDDMPTASVIYKWRRGKPEFKERFDIAYESKMYRHIDELYEMMNEELPTIESIEDDLGVKLDPTLAKSYLNATLQKRRMKIDTLKFIAGKLVPKLVRDMSDKVEVQHSGGTGINVILPDWSKGIKQLSDSIVIDGDDKDDG